MHLKLIFLPCARPIVRFLETFRRFVFVHVPHWITFHFLIHYLAIQEFLQFCGVLLFFHNLCPGYSWIPLEFCVCFQICLRLYIRTEKRAYLTKERVLLYSKTDRLAGFSSPSLSFFFLLKKLWVAVLTFIFVVKDWIIVISSEKGYRLLSYVCPQRKYYTPYGKIFFQIL